MGPVMVIRDYPRRRLYYVLLSSNWGSFRQGTLHRFTSALSCSPSGIGGQPLFP